MLNLWMLLFITTNICVVVRPADAQGDLKTKFAYVPIRHEFAEWLPNIIIIHCEHYRLNAQ